MRIAPSIHLTPSEHQQLKRWARGRRTPTRVVLRAKIALLAAAGHDNQHIAATLRTSRQTVGLWRQRFATQRLLGLAQDAPRGGRPPKARQALTARILQTTTQTQPPAATHWSTRTLARYLGTNPTLVQRVWTAHGLQPHRVGYAPSSSVGIRTSRRNWKMWWGCISTHPSMPWSCRWMRKAKSKRWSVPSPAYR